MQVGHRGHATCGLCGARTALESHLVLSPESTHRLAGKALLAAVRAADLGYVSKVLAGLKDQKRPVSAAHPDPHKHTHTHSGFCQQCMYVSVCMNVHV
jgi:hypothetical protein